MKRRTGAEISKGAFSLWFTMEAEEFRETEIPEIRECD